MKALSVIGFAEEEVQVSKNDRIERLYCMQATTLLFCFLFIILGFFHILKV